MLLCVGACAEGIGTILSILEAFNDEKTSLVILQQAAKDQKNHFLDILKTKTQRPVLQVESGTIISLGNIYLVPPGQPFGIDQNMFVLESNSIIDDHRTIDHFLISAVENYDKGLAALILSGLGTDGIAGAKEFFSFGCDVFIQDPTESASPYIPENIIRSGFYTKILNSQRIQEKLKTTNERLIVSKEELNTPGRELKHRIEERSESQSDFKNLVGAIDTGVLFLDSELRLRNIVGNLAKKFSFRDTDIGRDIFELDFGGYIKVFREKLFDNPIFSTQLTILSADNEYHQCLIKPYLDDKNRANGFIVVMQGIAQGFKLKKHSQEQNADDMISTYQKLLSDKKDA